MPDYKIKTVYPLTPMQEGMLFHKLLENGSDEYFEQTRLLVKGNLAIREFQASFQELIDRHDILRTVIVHQKVRAPRQVVLEQVTGDFYFEDIREKPEAARQKYLQEFVVSDRQRGFDLTSANLIRLAVLRSEADQYLIIWSFHHILMDGWCLGIINREMMNIYQAKLQQKEWRAPAPKPYAAYVKWLGSRNREADLGYWRDYLAGYEEPAVLPGNARKGSATNRSHAEVLIEFDPAISEKIRQFAQANQVTLNSLLRTFWGILLQRYNNTDDVVFGAVVSGRPAVIEGVEAMVGLFINTIPVRVKSGPRMRFLQLLTRVGEEGMESEQYSYLPLAEIQGLTPAKSQLINQIMVFENFPLDRSLQEEPDGADIGFQVETVEVFEETNYDFNLIITPGIPLKVKLIYNAGVYSADQVQRFMNHWRRVMVNVLERPEMELSEIEWVDEAEKRQILCDFNDTTAQYPKEKTILALFEEQAKRVPENPAILWEDQRISYRELNRRANILGQLLRDKGVQSDTIVGILAERSLAMMIGIFGILKAGAAYLPIDPQFPMERIRFMLEDSEASILLVQPQHFKNNPLKIETMDLEAGIPSVDEPRNLTPVNRASDLAYVIYTSGTTGRPKGVMIEHGALLNRIQWMQRKYPLTQTDTLMQKTNYTFDVSVWELVWWSMVGAKLFLLKAAGEKSPADIAAGIAQNHVSVIHFVPSMFQVFLEYLSQNPEAVTKIGSLRRVFASGEELKANQVELFQQLISNQHGTQLVNLYGPTEATVDVSYYDCNTGMRHGPCTKPVPIGKPIDNIQLFILDKLQKLTPIGISGELYIAGTGLARGYMNRPELTADKFISNSFHSLSDGANVETFHETSLQQTPLPKLYRTGDLARWLPDGNIEYLGRMDQQVKIRGYRIETGEIENRLLQMKEIQEAVVVVREDGEGLNYLCGYLVARKDLTAKAIREHLAQELPEYMIPAYFVQLEQLPLNPNGKIDRKQLPEPDTKIKSGVKYEAPGDALEMKLVQIWQETLNQESVGIRDNFFELGGHSLKAMNLISRIYQALNVEIPLKEIFARPTIKELAEMIRGLNSGLYVGIQTVTAKEYYEMSSAQKRMFFIHQMEQDRIAHNMTVIMELAGALDREKLSGVMQQLVDRHESFRTFFTMVDGVPVQKIQPRLDFKMGYRIATEAALKEIFTEFIQPFDLGTAPLFRAELVKINEHRHLIMLDMHHIISDGTSLGILAQELAGLYEEKELPELRIQYKDFSEWQNRLIKDGQLKRAEEYWLQRLSGAASGVDLPVDFERPAEFSFEGDRYGFKLEAKDALPFKELSQAKGVTLFINLLTIINILMYKYTGQEDIVIGCAIAGRPHVDLRNIIGMFVNSLALRNYPEGPKTYAEFLEEVKISSLEGFENQAYQFEELVEKLNPERDVSRNPIFNVALNVQNFEGSSFELKELNIKPYPIENYTTKNDLAFFVWEDDDGLALQIEYYRQIFTKESMSRLSRYFTNVVRQVTRNPHLKIADIELLDAAEKQIILEHFNGPKVESSRDKTIQRLFEEQVDKIPEQPAVTFGEQEITYRDLERQANQLANYLLLGKGLQPEQRVGLLMDCNIGCITGILSVLKAGGAYVPIDPQFPEDRIKTIINDADLQLIISEKKYVRVLNRLQWNCPGLKTYLCPDSDQIQVEEEEASGLMDEGLWNYVGETAKDDIAGGGWQSSYTGEYLSRAEMDEYGENIVRKLAPLLHQGTKVLEIGCASGISMYRIAPRVGFYYGTDLSRTIIEKNRQKVEEMGLRQIKLECLPAHAIDGVHGYEFDIIIINSVVQAFPGLNYLRGVIKKAIGLLKQDGYLFLGDLMDQDLKADLIADLKEFQLHHPEPKVQTKTDFTEELFVSRRYLEDLQTELTEIQGIEFSRKVHTIENELTRYRYDALLKINKGAKNRHYNRFKNKEQEDRNTLQPYSSERPQANVNPGNLAYVIYTSGTTGRPKGVMVEHRGIVNYTLWRIKEYGIGNEDRTIQLLSYTFAGFGSAF